MCPARQAPPAPPRPQFPSHQPLVQVHERVQAASLVGEDDHVALQEGDGHVPSVVRLKGGRRRGGAGAREAWLSEERQKEGVGGLGIAGRNRAFNCGKVHVTPSSLLARYTPHPDHIPLQYPPSCSIPIPHLSEVLDELRGELGLRLRDADALKDRLHYVGPVLRLALVGVLGEQRDDGLGESNLGGRGRDGGGEG